MNENPQRRARLPTPNAMTPAELAKRYCAKKKAVRLNGVGENADKIRAVDARFVALQMKYDLKRQLMSS